MAEYRVWIVEDEAIVALDIKNRLVAMGYDVPGISGSAEDAIEQIRIHQPDIVLMDIVLKGEMDGITAAGIIREEMGIPIIYLTAYAEEKMISRAKETEPYGYIQKPFEEKDLFIALELGLYKSSVEEKLRNSEKWISTMIRSMGEGVISTDTEGTVIFMNPVAEDLTGVLEKEAIGLPSSKLFPISTESTTKQPPDPVLRALISEKTISSESAMVLTAHDGTERYVEYTAAPIQEGSEHPAGAVLIFRDVTARFRIDEELRRHREQLEDLVSERTMELRKANARLKQMLHYIDMTEKRWVQDMLLSEVHDPDITPNPAMEGVVSIDRDLSVLLINVIGEELTGWKQDEAADYPVSSVLIFEDSTGAPLDCPFARVLENGDEHIMEDDCFLIRKSHGRIPVAVRIEPICDPDGGIIGATITIQRRK